MFETLILSKKEYNKEIRLFGFQTSGQVRPISKTSLLANIKDRCRTRNRNPTILVCITMYNEDEIELKRTLRGLLHNYNCFRADKDANFTKDDFNIFILCDGYEKIPESCKKYLRSIEILDESILER